MGGSVAPRRDQEQSASECFRRVLKCAAYRGAASWEGGHVTPWSRSGWPGRVGLAPILALTLAHKLGVRLKELGTADDFLLSIRKRRQPTRGEALFTFDARKENYRNGLID